MLWKMMKSEKTGSLVGSDVESDREDADGGEMAVDKDNAQTKTIERH